MLNWRPSFQASPIELVIRDLNTTLTAMHVIGVGKTIIMFSERAHFYCLHDVILI